MYNSIVVYRIKSENPEYKDMNVSYGVVMHLRNMGIVEHDVDAYQVIREGDVTVTVYTYRKVS